MKDWAELERIARENDLKENKEKKVIFFKLKSTNVVNSIGELKQ